MITSTKDRLRLRTTSFKLIVRDQVRISLLLMELKPQMRIFNSTIRLKLFM